MKSIIFSVFNKKKKIAFLAKEKKKVKDITIYSTHGWLPCYEKRKKQQKKKKTCLLSKRKEKVKNITMYFTDGWL